MKRLPLLMTCLLCSVAPLADEITAGQRATAGVLMAQALASNSAYAIVESLTTEVGPRLAGTEAEQRARAWAVAAMRKIGLQNVRVETFEIAGWRRGTELAEIVAPFPQPLTATTLGGSTGTGPEGLQAEVILFSSLAELEAAPAARIAGKIVFIDEPMTRTQDGSGYALAGAKRWQGAYVAQDKGAVAALIRSVGTSSHRFAHTGQMFPPDGHAGEGVPAAALSAPDADQLRRALERQEPVTVKLVLRPVRAFTAISGNVIGEIQGSGAPNEIVLAGAHLDSWDLGTGAVDDGAGVGIVLGAAQLLLDELRQQPRRTVRIVLFGAEETELGGARDYAVRYADELPYHIVAVESDFGAGDIWRFDTRFPAEQLFVAATLAEVLKPLGIAPGTNESRGGPDLRYLREAGVPVVDLKQNGWDYFDLHHTADDTLDKIALDALDQNVAAYAAFLYLMADSALLTPEN